MGLKDKDIDFNAIASDIISRNAGKTDDMLRELLARNLAGEVIVLKIQRTGMGECIKYQYTFEPGSIVYAPKEEEDFVDFTTD